MILLNRKILRSILKNKHDDSFLDDLSSNLKESLSRFGINTKLRIAAFIAQCAHESAEFTRTAENLNYSAQGLANTWPNRFALPGKVTPNELAMKIQRNPEEIANIVYAGRMGNGDSVSGDGWKYKGRGFIQITGRDMYSRIGSAIGIDLVLSPALAESPAVALKTACAFWSMNDLNKYADQGDITRLTRVINGGLNGLKDRQEYYDRALAVLS